MNELIILIIGCIVFTLYFWLFKQLPKEHFQFLAVRPYKKCDCDINAHDQWDGINFTYYGLFNANAYTFAIGLAIVLMGSIEIYFVQMLIMTVMILLICIPSSKLLAQLVEKKAHVFSVGAASFVGIMFAPWIVYATHSMSKKIWDMEFNCLGVLAAISIAYAMGEAIGRLACVSFGCCYGRPIKDLSISLQKLLLPVAMVYEGKTKKIAYESQMDGIHVIPIQAITSIIYTIAGLGAMYLFLEGFFSSAFIIAILTTQLWRFISEFLRADYRGDGKITVYQWMSLISCIVVLPIPFLLNMNNMNQLPNIMLGMTGLWQPSMIIFLQGMWLITFLYTGRSNVTKAKISFQVVNTTC